MNEPTDNMVALLQVTKSAMEMYAREHPKWFKRIEGSPIPNDVSVIMAEYIFVHLLKQERANRSGVEPGSTAHT